MRKIPTIFERDWTGNRALVTDTPNPDADWVFAGEGEATIKWDGSSVLMRVGEMFKRYEVKAGKTPPPDFRPADEVDPETGKQAGWVPVDLTDPADQWHVEALAATIGLPDGTYELVGPKVQGNPYGLKHHELWRHGSFVADLSGPVSFDSVRIWLIVNHEEGIVWHHPDGRMAKIKARDFGMDWP